MGVVCFALTLTVQTEGHVRGEHVKGRGSPELHVDKMLTVPVAVQSKKLLDGGYGGTQSMFSDYYSGLYSDYSDVVSVIRLWVEVISASFLVCMVSVSAHSDRMQQLQQYHPQRAVSLCVASPASSHGSQTCT